ncbi:MAG: pyruvate kinase [Lysobacterales bacterium]
MITATQMLQSMVDNPIPTRRGAGRGERGDRRH